MYVPKHFEMTPEQWGDLLRNATTAQVVAAYAEGPEATLLPVRFAPASDGGIGSLLAHVTRTNPLWKREPLGDVLAILSGPDAYVMPEWFPDHAENPGVPTWNYVTVHAYGDLVVHDDAEWSRRTVAQLSADHGYDVSQVPDAAMDVMLRAIVGIELRLTRVIAKAKLSQNKPAPVVDSLVAGLRGRGEERDLALADAMATLAMPHALARDELVAEIRDGRRRHA